MHEWKRSIRLQNHDSAQFNIPLCKLPDHKQKKQKLSTPFPCAVWPSSPSTPSRFAPPVTRSIHLCPPSINGVRPSWTPSLSFFVSFHLNYLNNTSSLTYYFLLAALFATFHNPAAAFQPDNCPLVSSPPPGIKRKQSND